jgi:hypothetical protein
MPQRTRLRVALVKCGNCGGRYSNPLTHTCPPRSTRSRGKTKLAPRASLSYTCPNCGQQASSPLSHVCKSKRGDFKQRLRAAKARERKAKRDANRHEPENCPEGGQCGRYPCKVWREGYDRGFEDGHRAGYSSGYDAGFQAGQDAASKE